jgi:FeS assembly SUF system regulator
MDMIRMTKQTDYGILVLLHFSEKPERLPKTARQIASGTGLSLPMVSKVLKLLSQKGFLTSQRGFKGGYVLSRPAEKVSVVEVISALEGPIALTACTEGTAGQCRLEGACPAEGGWHTVQVAVLKALDQVTLASMSAQLSKGSGGAAE